MLLIIHVARSALLEPAQLWAFHGPQSGLVSKVGPVPLTSPRTSPDGVMNDKPKQLFDFFQEDGLTEQMMEVADVFSTFGTVVVSHISIPGVV